MTALAAAREVDVAIVGAGPAGASTALHLLRALPGVRIALVDRARFPREKPCGGAISGWGLEVLARLAATPRELGVESVAVRTIRVRHRSEVGEHRTPPAERPLGEVVRRTSFDAALAREAERRGATLHEGRRLVAVARERSTHELSMQTDAGIERLRARLVVGADGTGSAVRRLVAGLDERGPRARALVVETGETDRDDVVRPEGGVLEFDMAPLDGTIDGYGWSFATTLAGRPAVSRGVWAWRGRREAGAESIRRALDALLAARGADRGTEHVKPYSARVFADSRAPIARADGVLLVGEAAGFVDPITGEGIAQALASGEQCAAETMRTLHPGGSVEPARYAAALAASRWHRHLRQTAALAPIIYGRYGSLCAEALAGCAAAIAAGGDWYVGSPLGWSRKAWVGGALAVSMARAGARRARG